MHPPSLRTLAFGAVVALTLSGCTGPTPPQQPGSSASNSSAPSASAQAPSGDTAAALQAIRQDAPALPTAVASTQLTNHDHLSGCTFEVMSVTSTPASTVMDWGLDCGRNDSREYPLGPTEMMPALKVGEDTYRVTRVERPDEVYGFEDIFPRISPTDGARVYSTPYAPLPTGTTSVQVESPLFTAPITVPVTAPQAYAGGTPEFPILARRTLLPAYGTGGDNKPLLVSVHGIRRVPHATAVYLSLTTPDGSPPDTLDGLNTYGSYMFATPDQSTNAGGWYANENALLDQPNQRGYAQMAANEVAGPYEDLAQAYNAQNALGRSDQGIMVRALLPELPADKQAIDLVLGGRTIIQDLPVADGPLTPTSNEEFPPIGTGWPELPTDVLASLPPEEYAKVTGTLIPVVSDGKITEAGDTLELNTAVLFDYNKDTLTPEAGAVIDDAVAQISEVSTTGKTTITGHTDNTGEDAYNLDLSQRRAQAVADAIATKLPNLQITVEGKGETEPTASNDTEEGKALNRRVTITLPTP